MWKKTWQKNSHHVGSLEILALHLHFDKATICWAGKKWHSSGRFTHIGLTTLSIIKQETRGGYSLGSLSTGAWCTVHPPINCEQYFLSNDEWALFLLRIWKKSKPPTSVSISEILYKISKMVVDQRICC